MENTERFCFLGPSHTCSNGLIVKRGQSFIPTNQELKSFGDLMLPVAVAAEQGKYTGGPATKIAELESVDAARERIHAEENEIAARRGRGEIPHPEAAAAPVAPPAVEAVEEQPDPAEQDDSGAESEPDGDAGDEQGVSLEELQAMSIKDLRALAKENELSVKGLRSKADIAQAIFDQLD